MRRAVLAVVLAGCGAISAQARHVGYPATPVEALVDEALALWVRDCDGRCGSVTIAPSAHVSVAITWVYPSGASDIFYDPVALEHIRVALGPDAVVGVIAHELGHARTVTRTVDGWPRELTADREAGCLLAHAGRSPQPLAALFGGEVASTTHPDGAERVDAIFAGFQQCSTTQGPP
jgi:hypothetical protein